MKLPITIGMSMLLITVALPSIAESSACRSGTIPLNGFQEVPSILTNGVGTLKWELDNSNTSLAYTLTFSGLSSAATAAHIHFGQYSVNGGVMAFLCGGTKPVCPTQGGSVSGVITAADIRAIPAQGIDAGNFSEFLQVLQSGNAYANVHTTLHGGGEVRGQITCDPSRPIVKK